MAEQTRTTRIRTPVMMTNIASHGHDEVRALSPEERKKASKFRSQRFPREYARRPPNKYNSIIFKCKGVTAGRQFNRLSQPLACIMDEPEVADESPPLVGATDGTAPDLRTDELRDKEASSSNTPLSVMAHDVSGLNMLCEAATDMNTVVAMQMGP